LRLILEESVATIDKEHEEEEEIATLLEEEKIIEEAVLHTFEAFELDEESEPSSKNGGYSNFV
jgi:hypothetical protein